MEKNPHSKSNTKHQGNNKDNENAKTITKAKKKQ